MFSALQCCCLQWNLMKIMFVLVYYLCIKIVECMDFYCGWGFLFRPLSWHTTAHMVSMLVKVVNVY